MVPWELHLWELTTIIFKNILPKAEQMMFAHYQTCYTSSTEDTKITKKFWVKTRASRDGTLKNQLNSIEAAELIQGDMTYYSTAWKFCLPAERPHCRIILPVRHLRAVLKSETIIIALTLTVCLLRSRQSVNFKGKIASVMCHSI